jgi:hypothetical protein
MMCGTFNSLVFQFEIIALNNGDRVACPKSARVLIEEARPQKNHIVSPFDVFENWGGSKFDADDFARHGTSEDRLSEVIAYHEYCGSNMQLA